MKKLNKSSFSELILGNKNILDDDYLESFTKKNVTEFKIGNKYFYKLNDDNKQLIQIHKTLCENFLNSIPVNNSAKAYRKGLSYLNLFEPHRNGYYFLRLDISSFFHSIQEDLLKDSFSSYFEEDEETTLIDGFISLVGYEIPDTSSSERFKGKTVLPIGFQTSPVISNIVFRKMDVLIQKYCMSKGIAYSRYADDMLFSSSKTSNFIHSDSFYNEIKFLLSIDGFKINKRKTIKAEHTISLNGYIIDRENSKTKTAFIRVSNKKTKLIQKLIYLLEKGVSEEIILGKLFAFRRSSKYFRYLPAQEIYVEKYCKDQLINKIAGYRAFLISILKFHKKYQCVDRLAIEKYSCLVDSLNLYLMKLTKW